MSSSVLPAYPGVAWPVTRTLITDTTVQKAISGMETRTQNQVAPRYRWQLVYNILRSAAAFTEYQQMLGFINSRYGQFDTFQYQDSDDNGVTGQAIGTGDGSTTTFPLVRTLGGFVEPILAPNTVSHVYNNGTDSGGWTVSNWGTASPGVVTYASAPAAGHAITADFTYYWPCRFDMSSFDFSQFMSGLYELKSLKFISVKN